MNKKSGILFLLFSLICFSSFSQKSIVTGSLYDLDSNIVVSDAVVSLAGENYFETKSDLSGNYQFSDIPFGDYLLRASRTGYEDVIVSLKINEPEKIIEVLLLQKKSARAELFVQDNIPVVSLAESDLGEQSSQNVSGVLSASRDAFISASSFNWGVARFRIRGYSGENFTTLMNGAPMNDLVTGQTYWSVWGGLNDVLRNRDNTIGLMPGTFAFGGIGGAYDLDSRAARQRKQTAVSYALSNRNYIHRLMVTHSTGLMKNNWAATISFSKRWAQEGYIEGTYYDGYSYFASIEKLIGMKHSISLTTFGAPTTFARSTASVQELNDIAGTNYYNPNWGFQNGEKRSAAVSTAFQPVIILTHEWNINNEITLKTAASALIGKSASSGLDWYNAPDPRADYYRKLPSLITDSTLREQARELLSTSVQARQLDWDNFYHVNYQNTETVFDGATGDSITGNRSLYVLMERVIENKKFNVNTIYNHAIGEHVFISGGATWQRQISRFYQQLQDLLGGDFYLNLNQFAELDFPDDENVIQHDINTPNRIIREGEKFGYDYVLHHCKTSVWGQSQFKFKQLDFFIAGEITSVRYWREGKTRVGLFPDNSFGDSEKQHFFNYNVKGGITWKINGRNYLFANGAMLTRAPFAQDAFVSPRTRNQFADGLENMMIQTAEAGYLLKHPKFRGRLTGFFTEFNNEIQTFNFWHEEFRTLVNYTLTDVDTRHLGIEAALDASLYKGFGVTAVASIGQYYYTSRPTALITRDNTQEPLQRETIFAKNYNVSGSPQKAYTLGLNYRGKKFWFVNVSLNVFDDIFINISPVRRTQQAVDLIPENSELWDRILSQEEANPNFKDKMTLDAYGGKSFKLTKKRIYDNHLYLALNAGVTNILNNQNMVVNGYEQLRFDFTGRNPDRFASRYFYNYGATFFVNITLRMN